MAELSFGDAFIPPDKFEKGVDELIQSVDKLSKKFEALGRVIDVKATRKIKELREEIAKLPVTNSNASKSLAEYEKQINDLIAANQKLSKELKQYKQDTDKAKKSTEDLSKETEKLLSRKRKDTQATKKQSESVSELALRYLRTTVIVTQLYRGVLTLQNGINAAFASMVEFDKAMQQVRSITRSTDEEFNRLKNSAANLGATTEYTASEIANLQKELAKLGFRPQEIITATRAISNLATATGEDLSASARIAAATLRAFNMDASEMERLTNVMAGSFVRSGLDLEKFSEAMKFVAPNAEALNIDLETTVALMSKMADAGIRGTQVGTALRNIFSDLATPTSKLALRLGFTVNSSEELVKAFQMLNDQGVDFASVTQLVDRTALQQFQTVLKNIDSIEDLQKTYKDLEGEGRKLAFMMRDTLANDTEILNSSLDALGRNFFGFLDNFGRFDSEASNFREATRGLSKQVTFLSNQFELSKNTGELLLNTLIGGVTGLLDSFAELVTFGMADSKLFDFFASLITNLDNSAVAAQKSKEEAESFLRTLEISANKLNSFTLNSQQLDLEKQKYLELEEVAVNTFNSLVKEVEFYTDQVEFLSKKDNKALTATDIYNWQDYEATLNVLNPKLEAFKKTFELLSVDIDKVNERLTTSGQKTTDFAAEIAKLKAQSDAYVASLERQGQLEDKTLVQQAQTAIDISKERVRAIEEERKLRIQALQEQEKALGKSSLLQQEAENAKARAATLREQIKLENQLRQIRQTQADLTNRELIAQLNTELKVSDTIKNNTLVTFDARINATKKYYNTLDRLVNAEEAKELARLEQRRVDLGLMQEEYDAELTEIQQKYIQIRLENNNRYQNDLFNLEEQAYQNRLKIHQDFRNAQLNIDREGAKQNQAAINARLNQMAIERRGLTFMFNERKRLLEEERDLRIQQINLNKQLSMEEATNAYDDEIEVLKQNLNRGLLEQEDFDKLKIKKREELTAKLKTIEEESGSEIQQITDNTTQGIKDSWHETFVEIVEAVQQAMGSLFSFLSEKRKAELERLQEWEDARLEYVKGNAEAEALVRFEAEQRRKEIARKEAKDARAQALFEIALNTAVGISKAVTTGAFWMIPVLAALGAAQAATVLSTPLPEFYKGTDNAPEGLAKVDERGQELIYRKKRNVLELGSKNGERVTYLDRGDQVFTALQTKKLLKDGSDSIISNNLIADSVNRATSSERMVLKATDEDKIIRGLTSAIKSIPQSETIFDERGVSRRMRKRNNVVQTLNKRYKLG